MPEGSPARPLTILVWIAVAAILLIGGYRLLHHGHSADQQILINKSK